MKMKLISLWLTLALVLALGLTGCNMATPASVGTIGDVEISAGLYLLTQFNDYSTAANAAQLVTGETASDVDAVLNAPASGSIGDEEFTGTGKEYLARLVERDLDHYAAVETAFAEMGGELSEADLAGVQENTDSLWESSGELYEANGIGKETLKNYVANSYKGQALLDLYYGPDGAEPVDTAEIESFIRDDCLYLEGVQFPLLDYSTFTFASEEQTEEITGIAGDCAGTLTDTVPVDADVETVSAALQTAASEYVPKAMEAMGGSLDADMAAYYTITDLLLPEAIDSYTLADDSNPLRDALAAADDGAWTTVDLTSSLLAARRADPLAQYTAAELCDRYAVLDAMRGDELEARLYAAGAELPHALDQGAMNTYKAAKIKRTV